MKFPQDWSIIRLGDAIVDLQPGFAQRPGEDMSGIGQIRTHNITPEGKVSLIGIKYVSPSEKEYKKYLLKKGDVIFNNTNSEEWVGKTACYDIDDSLVFSNHMTRIRVDKHRLLPEFLSAYLHFLWSIGFSKSRSKRWVSQAGIDQKELQNYKLPLPSLPEQEHIVEILKKADRLRRHRQEIIEQERQLSSRLFVETFGDPERWGRNKIRLGDITDFITSGSRDWSKYYSSSDRDAKFIRVQNIKEGSIDLSDMAYVKPPDNSEAERSKVMPGDLLISITGTVGQAAVADEKLGDAYVSQHVALVRINGRLPVRFLAEFINHPVGGQLQIKRANYGQTKPGLNLQQIKNLWIPLFDEKKIESFLAQEESLDVWVRGLAENALSFDLLQEAVTNEAFSGILTDNWRKAHLNEINTWLREHAASVPRKTTRVEFKEIAPPRRRVPSRPSRRWLMDQLGEAQGDVYITFEEWPGTLVPSEDLDDFLAKWSNEHLEDAHDHVLRNLNQLAGMGLIAKVSVRSQDGDYVTGFRVFREEELSKSDDLRRLEALP